MKIGVIGNGIVGTAVAATFKKYLSCQNTVTIIDDKRPNQTSLAGQGYLWSIHRCHNPEELQLSNEAKDAWKALLEDVQYHHHDDDPLDFQPLLHESGSLLIAPQEFSSELKEYQKVANLLLNNELEYIPDVSMINKFVSKGICGLYYPRDLICNPSALVEALMNTYDIQVEHRTVQDLNQERQNFDVLICCAGPWINHLCNVEVVPIRGILLHTSPEEPIASATTPMVPMMEWGYGSQGYHFTLSFRGKNWLIGASREDIGFSLTDVDNVSETLLSHALQFVEPKSIGQVDKKTVGFRPALKTNFINGKRVPYVVEKKNDNLILCYGFEGQGVLFAAHAASVAYKSIESISNRH
jgi:glycine/D-amino acid oxidase-like deaminating enzyme